jgi:hypothetical protein
MNKILFNTVLLYTGSYLLNNYILHINTNNTFYTLIHSMHVLSTNDKLMTDLQNKFPL